MFKLGWQGKDVTKLQGILCPYIGVSFEKMLIVDQQEIINYRLCTSTLK